MSETTLTEDERASLRDVDLCGCESTENDARVQAVAQVLNRRTGSYMGSESWLPCAREVVDTLDALVRAIDRLTCVIPPAEGDA